MRFPGRCVVLADPGLLIAEFIQPSQRLQVPVVTLFQSALRRMGRHREISDLHGVSSRCLFSSRLMRARKHSILSVWPRYDKTAGQKFAGRSDATFPSPLVGEGAHRRLWPPFLSTPMLCIGYGEAEADEGSLF